MAVRDRNMFVWQAYVIVSSIVAVLLIVGMFMLWSGGRKTAGELAAARERIKTLEAESNKNKEVINRFKSMIGIGQFAPAEIEQMVLNLKNDPEMGPVETEFARIQSLFPASMAINDRTLFRLPQMLIDLVRKRNDEVTAARAAMASLEAQRTKEVEDHRRARETAELAQQKAEKDLADARIAHKEQVQNVNKQKDQAIKTMDDNKGHYDKELARLTSLKDKAEADATEKQQTILKQVEKLQAFENPDYAAAQGRITMVSNGATRAHVNIGSNQGLKKGITFAIIDANDTQITKAVPKAKLVIQNVSSDSASGEVYFGDDLESKSRFYNNIVKTGDQIYSPVWRSGRKMSFALVGKMDINGDFQDDIDQVRQIIEAAGGVIDAELPVRGQEKGKISPSTDTLVIGTDVESIAGSQGGDERAKDYAKFIAKANANGLEAIDLEKLMGLLKVDESLRVVPLGKRIQASDFKIRNQVSPQSSTGTVSEIFSSGQKKP